MQKLLQLSKHTQKFFVTAILLTIPLYPKFPFLRIPGTYVSIRLEDFLIALTLLFLAPVAIKNLKELFGNKVIRSILLFLTVGLVSLISGLYLTQTVSFNIGLLHYLRRVEYFSLFVIGFLYIKENYEKGSFEYIIKVLLISNLIIFLYGLGQRYLSFPIIVTQNEEYSKGIALRWIPGAHINSTFAGHYDLASYIVLTVPIFIALIFTVKNKFSKFIFAAASFIGFWLLSSAVSRISIVAFMGAVSVTLFLLKEYKAIIISLAISALVFGYSPDLRARYKRIIDVTLEKISLIQTVVLAQEGEQQVFEDRSTSIRLNVEWPRAIRAFNKNPLLGTGYSSISLATDNDYLRILGELGVLGILAFALIFINLAKPLWKFEFKKITYKNVFITGVVGSTMGILLTAVFIDIFEASKFAIIFWLFAGFVISAVKYKYNE